MAFKNLLKFSTLWNSSQIGIIKFLECWKIPVFTGWTTSCGLDLISFQLKKFVIFTQVSNQLLEWKKKRKLDLHAYGVLQWNWHIPAKEFEMMIIIMVMYLLGSLLLAMQSLPFRLPMSIHTNVLFKCRSVRQILCIPNTYLWALLVNYRVYHYQNRNFRAIRLNALFHTLYSCKIDKTLRNEKSCFRLEFYKTNCRISIFGVLQNRKYWILGPFSRL